MKIELALNIVRNDKVEASRAIGADSLSLLPIPVPCMGEHIVMVVHGTLYRGIVSEKKFDLTEIEHSEDGVVRIEIFADEESGN